MRLSYYEPDYWIIKGNFIDGEGGEGREEIMKINLRNERD